MLPANLTALGLPPNRYLDPIRQKAEAEERKTKKGKERQKLREERAQRNNLKRAQKEKRAAKKVQRMWRVRAFRRSINAFMMEKKAAVMVQARIRGILFRRRTREALIGQIENIAATKLQAAVRGSLLRKQLERRRKIKQKKAEALKSKVEDVGAAKLVRRLDGGKVIPCDSRCLSCRSDSLGPRLHTLTAFFLLLPLAAIQGHVAFLERVGLKPTESSNDDGTLGSDNYTQLYAANKVQAVWRGKQGRRRAEERAAALRNEYSEMMLTISGKLAVVFSIHTPVDTPKGTLCGGMHV